MTETAESEWWGTDRGVCCPPHPMENSKYAFVHVGPIRFLESADSQKGSFKFISILVLGVMCGVGRLTGPPEKQLQSALLPGLML